MERSCRSQRRKIAASISVLMLIRKWLPPGNCMLWEMNLPPGMVFLSRRIRWKSNFLRTDRSIRTRLRQGSAAASKRALHTMTRGLGKKTSPFRRHPGSSSATVRIVRIVRIVRSVSLPPTSFSRKSPLTVPLPEKGGVPLVYSLCLQQSGNKRKGRFQGQSSPARIKR